MRVLNWTFFGMQSPASLDSRVTTMDCKLNPQLPRPCTAIWASPFASHMLMNGSCFANFGNRTGQGLGLFSGRSYRGQEVGIASLNCPENFYLKTRPMIISRNPVIIKKLNLQSGRGPTFSMRKRHHSRRGKVANQSSSQESIAVSSEEELKDRLEALQEEALNVRDRCNNARSRFVRLTEAAQQLRRRAGFDIDAGNEDSARSLLVEKQKVLRAAELSKRRARVLEELSNKLGEAIAKVENQLVFTLMSSHFPKEELIVRAVAPKHEHSISMDADVVDTREDIATARENPIKVADDALEAISQNMRGEEREGMEPFSSSEDVPTGKGTTTEKNHIFRDLYSRESELEATITEVFSDRENPPVELKEFEDNAGKSEPDLQSRQSFISTPSIHDDISKSESRSEAFNTSSGTADFAETDMPRVSSPVTIGKDDLSTDAGFTGANPKAVDEENEQSEKKAGQGIADLLPTERESVRASGDNILFDEGGRTFEEFLEDIDCDVAAVEAKLIDLMSTTVSGNQNKITEKIENVGQLLNQVQSLRNRMSEVAKEHRGKGTACVGDSYSVRKDVKVSE